MRLDPSDKAKICDVVSAPFERLSETLTKGILKPAAIKVFREKWQPLLEQMRAQFPTLWNGLEMGNYLQYEDPSKKTAPWCTSTCSVAELNEKWPRITGVIRNTPYPGEDSKISLKEMQEFLSEAAREKSQKAEELLAKARNVEKLLGEWLKPFSKPEQLQFSMPVLGYFLQKMDFRKRGKWSQPEPPPLATQRRPRIVNVPSEELRILVSESAILAQSGGLPKEEE